jgi:hypothetical protein
VVTSIPENPGFVDNYEWGRFMALTRVNEHGYRMWIGGTQNSEDRPVGEFYYNHKKMIAHRVAYYMYHGIWPTYTIDHICERPLCVDERCLEDVTMAVNLSRSTKLAAWQANNQFSQRTHCDSGHEYTPENTRMRGNTRICKTCRRLTARRLRAVK